VRTKEKYKREREDASETAVRPEVDSYRKGCTSLSVVKDLVTEPILTLEIREKELEFMVDTGAMVSVIQP
jgi:predicted aspartyl protease